jgi:hypothetical protein
MRCHTIWKTKDVGQPGYATLKLDMSKAYDRVEWTFLEKMMTRLGVHPRWTELMMKCITTASYQIKVNGKLTEEIIPIRGLRQGDPLSLYLFLIYVLKVSQLC